MLQVNYKSLTKKKCLHSKERSTEMRRVIKDAPSQDEAKWVHQDETFEGSGRREGEERQKDNHELNVRTLDTGGRQYSKNCTWLWKVMAIKSHVSWLRALWSHHTAPSEGANEPTATLNA